MATSLALLACVLVVCAYAQETTIKGFVDQPLGRPQDVVHLQEAKGDKRPGPPSMMRIYGHRFCPFTQRVLLTAHHHAVPFEVVNLNPASQPAWFRAEINPRSQVPVIEYPDGRIYYHSEALVELVDKTSANWSSALCARDPFVEAEGRSFRDVYDGFVKDNYYVAMWDGNATRRQEAFDEILETLEEMQPYMEGPFVSGEKPHVIDFLIYPWLERLAPLATIRELEGGDITETMPKWRDWFKAMRATEGVQGAYLPAAQHVALVERYLENPDPAHYDIFL